ncbi:DUF748 domain-containing protein [Rhodoferax sp. PAMC 29310]|uniref:DUF748 domain-containing protein n=1 Tax=Rhodoferax sp. PAMC 29310 TaxID=2822760 RepID=UPI001B3456CA|nr:DUF748 domain-containing protein [Rhodoferax sp. PAMC 29310]
MLQKLRRFLLSLPVLSVAGLCSLYLAGGFWGLPALVKWQGEKLVREKLGQNLSVAEIHFNPLVFQLEVRDLALADEQGKALLGFQRLWVDFELWRSLVDQTWTFSEAALDAPQLQFTQLKNGQHNFSALLAKLQGDDTAPQESSPLPRLAVQRLTLSDGVVEVSDEQLDQPLISRIAPLALSIEGLSTGAKPTTRYQLTMPTAQGESLTSEGSLSLKPIAVQGQLALKGIQVNTLVRALSRWVAIDAPAGLLAANAHFDLAVNAQNQLAGILQNLGLDAAGLSISAPGGAAPLLALEKMSLTDGRVDLVNQQIHVARFALNNGQVNAATNAQGQLDWATLVRARPDTPPEPPAAPPWQVSIANASISSVAVNFQDVKQGQRAKIDSVALSAAPRGEFGPSTLALQLGPVKLAVTGVQLESPGQQLTLPALEVKATQANLNQGVDALKVSLDAPYIGLAKGLSAQDATNRVTLASTSLQADRATLTQSGASTQASLSGTQLALTGATFRQDGQDASLGEGAVRGQELTLNLAPGQTDINISQWGSTLSQLKAQRGTESAALDQLTVQGAKALVKQGANTSLSATLQTTAVGSRGAALKQGDDALALVSADLKAEQLALTLDKGQVQLNGTSAALDLTGLNAQQGENRLSLASGGLATRQLTLDTTGALQARLSDTALSLSTMSVKALGAPGELGQVAQATMSAQSLQLTLPEGPLELTGDGLSAELTQTVLNSPADGTELIKLGRAALAGGVLRLPQQQFTADTLTLADGQAHTWLDANGQFSLIKLFDTVGPAKAGATPSPAPAPAVGKAAAAAPWRIAVKQTTLDAFVLGFEDRQVQPPLALRLDPIRAQVKNLDTGASAPLQLDLNTKLASGGEIQAVGTAHATTGAADLQLTLNNIALAPVQGYLSKFAELQLASGTASSSGRLRYGDPQGAGAQLIFEGKAAVNQFLLNEVEPQRPFLGWTGLGSDDIVLTLNPNRLDMAELRIDQPSGRLIIAADQSINLTDVLKKTESEPAPAKESTPSEAVPAASDPFPVSIARVRVADGTLEFSDASLRPQFAARMHELKGVVTGLSNDPNQSAKLQLDARVDQYGSAKIGGQIGLMSPEKLTEIDISFRNLEMTSLSPYVVKFAGYRIAAGRLWLDLQYRIKDGKLLGENKVVLKKVALGEKVESPNALNLPLELAIAILSDSDGVIDIGLPVSGDLNDPKFDYGTVIGKAIGNLLGGIVTDPFRALAALFGGGEKTLDTVIFEPGTATLAPPERQKLAAVARALKERPTLKLVVPPTRSDDFDTPVLKSLAVRRDIITAMGITLAPGEDPGPVDVANARTQKAVEAVFSTRYAPEVLAALKARAMQAVNGPADAPQPPTTNAATGAPIAANAPPQPPTAFYQGLLDRLLSEQPVSDEALAQLATQRSDAIVTELTQTLGVSGARTSVGKAETAAAADPQSVTLKLQLEVAK